MKGRKYLIPILILAIILSLCVVLTMRSGRFTKYPKVKAVAENCYSDTLFVITDQDYRPYSFIDKDGDFSGHDVELITILANKMHMNLDLKFMSWNDGIAATIAGKAQVLMTCDYSDSFAGTEQLLKSQAISTDEFIVYSKSRMTSVNELYGKRIGIMANGNVQSHVEILNLEPYCVRFADNREAMKAVIDGSVDCALMRNAVGSVLLQELSAKEVKGYFAIGQSFMCFGINDQCTDILERLNKALGEVKVDGELQTLSEKWLTTFVAPYSFAETIANNIELVILCIILLGLMVLVLYINEKHKLKTIQERDYFIRIVENLSNDFECVNYVPLNNNKLRDQATLIRISDTLKRNIPEWSSELIFSKRLDIMANTIVSADDRDSFKKQTRREFIIRNVENNSVHYVNFRAIIDGEEQFFQMKFSPVNNNHGKLIGLVCGLHNVDLQTKMELHAKEQLEYANKAKTDFLFNMSHDIRTPMNAIIGFTNMAKKHLDDPERAKDCLKKIETSGNHLLELINEVLDMSRVEAGKMYSELKDVNVIESSQKIITICQETAGERNIKLSFKHENITHDMVAADELHINQILMNIIGNGIKYTLPGGEVCMTVSELESGKAEYGLYRFRIQDTGIGMSKEFIDKIFDSFSREENETVNGIQGTGLGMSIVKRLVDYMKGTIKIESEQGKGTTVTVTLPLVFSVETDAHIMEEEPSYIDLSGKKVLLVEDNDLNREIAGCLLADMGIIFDEARDGVEAFECVRSKGCDYYDCILMDIQMPFMDGYESTQKIRQLPGADQLIIIALSANAFEEDRMKSLDAGMNDHLAKPINPQELKETLAMYL